MPQRFRAVQRRPPPPKLAPCSTGGAVLRGRRVAIPRSSVRLSTEDRIRAEAAPIVSSNQPGKGATKAEISRTVPSLSAGRPDGRAARLTRIRLHSRQPPPPESPHSSQRKPTVTQLGSLHRPRNHGQPISSTLDRPRCQIDAAYSAAYVGYRGVLRFGVDEWTVIEIWPRHRSTRKGKISSESAILRHTCECWGLPRDSIRGRGRIAPRLQELA